MADLFSINRTSIYEALEGLPQDRIEGFLDIEVQDTVGKCKGYAVFEALDGCRLAGFSLNEVWSEWERLAETLKIGVAVKYLNWQGNVEDSFAWKEVFL